MAKKKNKKRTAMDLSKPIRGLARKEHFENGGTVEGWRGIHTIQKDKRTRRKRTRGNRDKAAIRESQED